MECFTDAVINALYSEIDNLNNQYFGPDYTILRNESKKLEELLIMRIMFLYWFLLVV